MGVFFFADVPVVLLPCLPRLGRSHLTCWRPGLRSPAGQLTATRGHRKPSTDDAGPLLHLEQIRRNEIIGTKVPLQCMHKPAPHSYFQNISFGGGNWNIPLGWKNMLPKYILIEWASTVNFEKLNLYCEWGSRKIVLQKNVSKAPAKQTSGIFPTVVANIL